MSYNYKIYILGDYEYEFDENTGVCKAEFPRHDQAMNYIKNGIKYGMVCDSFTTVTEKYEICDPNTGSVARTLKDYTTHIVELYRGDNFKEK